MGLYSESAVKRLRFFYAAHKHRSKPGSLSGSEGARLQARTQAPWRRVSKRHTLDYSWVLRKTSRRLEGQREEEEEKEEEEGEGEGE